MFRKISACLLLLLTLTLTLKGATDATLLLSDSRLNVSGQSTNRTIWLQRYSYPDTVNGTTVLLGDKIVVTNDSSGAYTFTNLASGLYQSDVLAPPARTTFRFYIPATNLGAVYVADYLVAASTATFPAGQVAWAASVTDNRYSRTTNSLTNYVSFGELTTQLHGYQATNAVLTQFGTLTTNTFVNTNLLAGSSNALYLFSQTLSTNATNFTLLYGTNATNFTVSTSNSLQSAISALGLAATNYSQSLTSTLWGSLGTAALSNGLAFYPKNNPSNFVDATITNALNARLGTAAFQNTNFFYAASNPNGYISTADTNGLASQAYVQGLTNTLWSSLGTAALSNGADFYPKTNPSNFVTATITNELNASLGTAARSNSSAFYSAGNPSGFITASATNGFAQQTYVQTLTNTLWGSLGTAALSNGLHFYPRSNPSNFVDATITNALSALLGTASRSNANAFYSAGNPSAFIDYTPLAAVSNSLLAVINPKQAGSANLTNWSARSTNEYLLTNNFYLLQAKDVTSNNIAAGHVLAWNGSKFTNGPASGGSSATFGFNANQFAGTTVTNIKDGVLLTNVTVHQDLISMGSLVFDALSANRVLYLDNDKIVQNSTVTDTELAYLSGAVGNIQTNLNARVANVDGLVTNSLTVRGNLSVITNMWANNALVTNKFTNSSLTASRFVVADANKALTTTATSAILSDTLSDESGTGLSVFNNSPYITNATFSGVTATNTVFVGVTTNAGVVNSSVTYSDLTDGANVLGLVIDVVNVKLSQLVTTNWSLAGVVDGVAGRHVRLFNQTGYPMTLLHESGLANTTERLVVYGSGMDTEVPNMGVVDLDYDGVANRWRATILTVTTGGELTYSATYISTDETTNTMWQIDLDGSNLGDVTDFTAQIIAISGDGTEGASYWKRGAFILDAGSVTQIGTTATVSTDLESNADYTATIDFSGTSVRVRVAGDTATEVHWKAIIRVITHQ